MKKRSSLDIRAALALALLISATMHLLFLIMRFSHRQSIPADAIESFGGVRIFISFVSTFIVTFVLYLFNFKVIKKPFSKSKKLWMIIVGSIVISALLTSLSVYIQTAAEIITYDPRRPFVGALFKDQFITLVVVLSSYLLYLSDRRQQIALEYEALKAENARTKYLALKNQVDPHFLFNSLNTLNAIITTDPLKAQEYVQQLSKVFRYTLQSKEIIKLSEEINFTKAYCALMEIRYGDSLTVVFDIDKQYEEYLVIPLSVQVLVENAIKHNIVDRKSPLTITVATAADGASLSVVNPLQPRKNPEEGEGIGLANLADRYRLQMQKEIEVSAGSGEFTVIIPL